MADMSNSGTSSPSLNLTAEEKRLYGQLYRAVDVDNLGVVTGEAAVKFFERTRLDSRVLGEIWQISDKQNRGLLTPAEFGIVLRLIGHYQAGREPSPELAYQPGPLPKFDGDAPTQPYSPSPTAPLQPQTSGSVPIRVPPLTPDKVAQYSQLFERSGAQNGVLSGDQAKAIFERAGLPNEVLGKVWNLADTQARGAFEMTEFVVAMHLLASTKSGAMRALPSVLPPGLLEAARRPVIRPVPGVAPPPSAAIPRQLTGANRQRVASPLGGSAFAPPQPIAAQLTGQTTGQSDWLVTPMDKQRFDHIYAGLDKTNKGFITGEEAVPFLSNSKLPEEALASIWDLADINSEGRLSRDEFAVAMYLIRQQRTKKDGRDNLPSTLPLNLIPPSMRMQVRPAPQPTAPAFEQAPPPTLPKSAADDLFGLDALSSPTQPALQPQSATNTGSSPDPFGNKSVTAIPTSPTGGSAQLPSTFKPFVPSSSFGQTLGHNHTGTSSGSGPTQQRGLQPQTTGMSNLLEDDDPEESKKLTNESAELANLSSQVGTLSKQMQDVQGQKQTSQSQLSTAASQKQQFETRLAQLRGLYEQEVKEVSALRQSLTASINDTQKLKQEIADTERSHQEITSQHNQLTGALQTDQQENISLKERMSALNAEIAQLKPQLERLRSDARQQKGMVAINKKQLATSEAEHSKMKTEQAELNRDIEEHSRSMAEAAQLQSTAAIASPALSTMSGSNPFFKRQGSGPAESPFRPASPVVPRDGDRSFDDIFGTSFGDPNATRSSMPPTTFKSETQAVHDTPLAAKEVALPPFSQESSRVASPAPLESQSTGTQDMSGSSFPPAPPVSRQINSSFLPFPPGAVESMTSSRHVSAPNSGYGDVSDGAFDEPTPTGSSIGGLVSSQETTDADIHAEPHNALDHTDSIPGAFPGDENSKVAATPTGSSTQSEPLAASTNNTGPVDPFSFDAGSSKAVAPKDDFDSAFANAPAPKDDFDSAFAGFGSSKPVETHFTGASGAASKTNQEFPPIQQLENDESDSESEGGFDDDFNAGSGGHSGGPSAALGGIAGGLQVPKALEPSHTGASSLGPGMEPPSEDAQASPPAYGSAASPQDKAHAEVGSFAGLLPAREVPPSHSPEQTFSGFSVPTPMTTSSFVAAEVQPQPPAKVPFDEFDDEFDDLEDAKEGGDDDDFASHDRSVIDDFNPTFDSPAHSKVSGHTVQGSTGFDSSQLRPNDFASSPIRATSPTLKVTTDNHDWDAIFSGLDGPTATATTTMPGDDEIQFAPPPGPPPSQAQRVAAAALGPAANIQSRATESSSSSGPKRPDVGRALTEAGVHDDPILKELTEMGYARKAALTALEKYDYNLERAANFLASES